MSVTGWMSGFLSVYLNGLFSPVWLLIIKFFYICFCIQKVVGTVEGGRAPTKIKTDLKKPIVNLACHPRLPVLVLLKYTCHNSIYWQIHVICISL
jgi:hypothetical protein